MSVDSIVSKVLTTYKADVSDHKAAIRSLRGEEKAAAQARLLEVERTNKGIDSQIAMWGKVAAGLGAVYGAVKIGHAAMNAYLEDVRLESAAAGANIGGLQKATAGLVETDNLLAFAGKSMNGVWKLNQSEMELVLQGALAMRKTLGVDLAPTLDTLTEAITKGSTRALKGLGLEVKDKTEMLGKFREMIKGLGGDTSLAGDEFTRSGVSLKNAFDDIQGQLGKMVVDAKPAIDSFVVMATVIAQATVAFVEWGDRVTNWINGVDVSEDWWARAIGGKANQQILGQLSDLREELEKAKGPTSGRGGFNSSGTKENIDRIKGEIAMLESALEKGIVSSVKRAADKLSKDTESANSSAGGKVFDQIIGWDSQLNGKKTKTGKAKEKVSAEVKSVLSGLRDEWNDYVLGSKIESAGSDIKGWWFSVLGHDANKIAESVERVQVEVAEATAPDADTGPSMLARMFGDQEDLEFAEYAANRSIELLGDVSNAAADAWVSSIADGKNFADSMEKATGQILRGLSKEFFIRGLGATAAGFTNPTQFGAAAAWFAASAAAAKAAGEFGGGGGSAPSRHSAGRSYNTSPRGSDSGPGERNVTIILDDSYYDETKRERSARLSRAIRTGMNDPGTNSIRHG